MFVRGCFGAFVLYSTERVCLFMHGLQDGCKPLEVPLCGEKESRGRFTLHLEQRFMLVVVCGRELWPTDDEHAKRFPTSFQIFLIVRLSHYKQPHLLAERPITRHAAMTEYSPLGDADKVKPTVAIRSWIPTIILLFYKNLDTC